MKILNKTKILLLILFLYSFFIILVFQCKSDNKAKINMIIPLGSFVGATIVESDNSTNLFEGTTTDTYTIVLNSKPSSAIAISANFDSTQLIVNDATVSPIQILFTPDNWNQAQTISVRAVFDNLTEGSHISVISHTSPSTNPLVGINQVGNVIANITDNAGSRLTSSFQSGTVTMGATDPLTVALTRTVNASNSYVYCNFQIGNSTVNRAATCQLSTDGASISIQTGTTSTSTVVNWYVVEFSTGALVLRGSESYLTTDTTKTISLSTAVDLSRTFVIAYSRTTGTGNNNDEQRTIRAQLLSTTSLEVSRNESGISADLEWQVIQLDGARVQSGISTIASGSTSVSATVSSVNLSNAFLLMTTRGGANVNGVEKDYYVQGAYTSQTNAQFTRTGTNDTVDIAWFAIEMVDGTTVQSGFSTVAATSSSSTVSLNSVDITKTMIVSSYQVETGDAGTTTQDSGTFSSQFASTTSIQFNRATQENNACIISWFAVQFQ